METCLARSSAFFLVCLTNNARDEQVGRSVSLQDTPEQFNGFELGE